MKNTAPQLRRTAAVIVAAAMLPAAPLFAQEVVTPPPVAAPPAAAPPIQATTTPPPVVTPQASAPPLAPRAAPVAIAVPEEPAAETAPVRDRSTPRTVTRTARAAPKAAPPRAAAPAPDVVEPAPVAAAPDPAVTEVPTAAAPPAEVAPAPVAETPAETAAPAPAEEQGGSTAGWLIGGLIVLLGALAGLFMLRRRRARAHAIYEDAPSPYEPAYEEAVPAVAAPAFGTVVEDAPVAAAEPAAIEALVDESNPVAGRPWIEFALGKVSAGTSDDDAVVAFELTVGNTGSVAAEHVRVSTWMLAAPDTDMERALIERPANATVSDVSIDPGEGARVDAAVATPKAGIRGNGSFVPMLVADARYTLPDGSEGRTAASFAIGVPDGEGLQRFEVNAPNGMHDDVEARLARLERDAEPV